MSTNIDLSLDDIIKLNKKKQRKNVPNQKAGNSSTSQGNPRQRIQGQKNVKGFRGRVSGKRISQKNNIGISPLNRRQRNQNMNKTSRQNYTQAKKRIQAAKQTLNFKQRRYNVLSQRRGLPQQNQKQVSQGGRRKLNRQFSNRQQNISKMRSDQILVNQNQKRRWNKMTTNVDNSIVKVSIKNRKSDDVFVQLAKQRKQTRKSQQSGSGELTVVRQIGQQPFKQNERNKNRRQKQQALRGAALQRSFYNAANKRQIFQPKKNDYIRGNNSKMMLSDRFTGAGVSRGRQNRQNFRGAGANRGKQNRQNVRHANVNRGKQNRQNINTLYVGNARRNNNRQRQGNMGNRQVFL